MSVIVTGPSCVVEVVVLLGVVVEVLDGNRMVEIEKDRTGRASFLKAAHVVLVQSPRIVLALYLVRGIVVDTAYDLHQALRNSQQ